VAKKTPEASDAPDVASADEKAKRRQVTLDPTIAYKARLVAASQDLSVPDYINNKLRSIVEADFLAMAEELGYEPKKR
jgi:predicted HicB family RNase H-like nuclease